MKSKPLPIIFNMLIANKGGLEMKYDTHTKPENIRPGSRKYEIHQAWLKGGTTAAYIGNMNSLNPVKEKTVTAWCCYWQWEKDNRRV